MARGQGKAASHDVNATTTGRARTNPTPPTEGEGTAVGSAYSAEIVERVNKSSTRNEGPSRDGGLVGETNMPVLTMGSRKTGRVG